MSKTTNQDKDTKPDPKEGSSRSMRIVVVAGVLVIAAVVTGIAYFVVNSKLSNTVSDEVGSTEDSAIVEAIENASPGVSFIDIGEEIKAEEQKLGGLAEDSKEWVEQQYNIASMYFSINDFDKAFSANEAALSSAKNIGDTELVKQLEMQQQSIIDKKQLLEQIGQ